MDISLKLELEKFIDEQVRAGRFSSLVEVLEAGLARLMLDPLPDALDKEDLAVIKESEQQIADGKDLGWKEASAQIRKKYLGE